MDLRILLCWVTCSAAACTGGGAQNGSFPSQRGTAAAVEQFDSAGASWTRSVSVRHLFLQRYTGDVEPERYVVGETFERVCCFQAEREVTSRLVVESRPLTRLSAPALWRAELFADDGEAWDEFYRAIRYGCCGSSDALYYFHMASGGPAYRASARRTPAGRDLPAVEVPNGGLRRYVAFLDRNTAAEVPEFTDVADVIGLLQYGPSSGPSERMVVRAAGRGYEWSLVDLGFALDDDRDAGSASRLDLWHADGRRDADALSGFDVVLELYDHQTGATVRLRVPVAADRLRPDLADLPHGIRGLDRGIGLGEWRIL